MQSGHLADPQVSELSNLFAGSPMDVVLLHDSVALG